MAEGIPKSPLDTPAAVLIIPLAELFRSLHVFLIRRNRP